MSISEDTILTMCNTMLAHARKVAGSRHTSALGKVRFEVNTALTSCAGRAYTGVDHHTYGLIQISLPIFARTPCIAELVETILHEIAHIMTPDAGHSLQWILAARSIGSTGERCHTMKKGHTKKEKQKIAARAVLASL